MRKCVKEGNKQDMRERGFNLIYFYQDQAEELKLSFYEETNFQLSTEESLLIIESYRRNCLKEMISVIAFLICRDEIDFIQIQRQQSYDKFLRQIFGEDQDFNTLKNQCDPVYYLQISKAVKNKYHQINWTMASSKLFNKIFSYQQALEEQLLQRDILLSGKFTPVYGEQLDELSEKEAEMQLKFCFLAVFATNLCALSKQNSPFLIFQGKNVEFYEKQDPYIYNLPTTQFFVLSFLFQKGGKKNSDFPLVISFSEEELQDSRTFTSEEFAILKDYVMTKAFEFTFPRSLREDLQQSLIKRIENKVIQSAQGEPINGSSVVNEKGTTLTAFARARGIDKLKQNLDVQQELAIINVLTYEEREMKMKGVQTKYLDEEYKCIFTFGDGLSSIRWLLPNEYDTIKIANFPGNEIECLEHYKLNFQALLCIQKKDDEFLVKCKLKEQAVQFLKHIQEKDEVIDKQNRVVVKPLIIEDLHTNKTRFIIDVKYKISQAVRDVKDKICSSINKFVKGEYEVQLSTLQRNDEKRCYLIFERYDRADFLSQMISGQTLEDIHFSDMQVSELKQGKITLGNKVYVYFFKLLKQIKSEEFKIIFKDDVNYWTEEVKVGLISKERITVQKDVIRLYQQQQLQETEDLIIQAKSNYTISKVISELSIILRPKHLLQLKDSFQYLIFSHEKGINYLAQLSVSNNMIIIFNPSLNRLEFYSKTTLKAIKPAITTLISRIQEFIDQFLVDLRFSVSPSISKDMVKYLQSKSFFVKVEQGTIHTKIRYSLLIKEREYIKEKFLQSSNAIKDDCQICYDSSELFELSNCKCKSICKACLKAHVRDQSISSITEFKQKIYCPNCSNSPISIGDINQVFDRMSLQSLLKIRFKSAIDNLKTSNGHKLFIGCQTTDCKGLLQIQENNSENSQQKNWKCPICQHDFCIKHIIKSQFQIPLHDVHGEEITCLAQSQDKGTEELVKAGLVKQCPKCKAKFSHEEGCNHLTCTKCNCHFCALCDFQEDFQKEIYNHLNEKHQGCFSVKPKNMKTVDSDALKELENKMKQKGISSNKDENEESQEEEIYRKYKIPLEKISNDLFGTENYEAQSDILEAFQVDGIYNHHQLGIDEIFN